MKWENKNVLVTGGASFIGSHLCENLLSLGADVTVADNFSSGNYENLSAIESEIAILEGDLKKWRFADKATADQEVVFHLAADHGGRGYIATHPADCATNMSLNNIVFETAVHNDVERITFASSACVYPTHIQEKKQRLKEDFVSFDKPEATFADETYGWSKLMGELSLKAFHKQYGVKASSVRIFTAYGPRENETHAIIALIAKAFIHQDPFEIWGDGEQTRNFTYVKDIVDALILASENITDGSSINAGIPRYISLNKAAKKVFQIMEWRPDEIKHLKGKPVGVRHRAADLTRVKELLDWEPKYTFEQGLRETIEWYTKNKSRDKVRSKLEKLLTER